MATPGPLEAACYYRAALTCLQFVEARRPTKRRFGPDADFQEGTNCIERASAFREVSASDRDAMVDHMLAT